MEFQHHGERNAAQAADRRQPAPPTQAAPHGGQPSWKSPAKESAPEMKLTSDGQLVEAGYGHGV